MSPIESVIITGEINIPGIYPVNSLTTLSDILSLSGGLNDNALEDGIEIFRDSLKIGWEKQNFILKDGDSLNVMKKTGLVFVDGEVNSPGFISYKSNQSLKKYIKKAGGLSSFADKNNIYVTYPNGTSSSVSSLIKPKIKDGSVIYVNQRTITGQSEMSGWQIFAMISSQAGSIATTLVSLSLLMSQNQ